MNGHLTPMRNREEFKDRQDLLTIATSRSQPSKGENIPINRAEDVLEALRSNPDVALLAKSLRWLTAARKNNNDFSLKKPSPKAAEILFALVNHTVPNFWQSLNTQGSSGHREEKLMLISCLRSVAGIGAVVARLRLLASQVKNPESQVRIAVAARAQPLYDLFDIVESILSGDVFALSVWQDIDACIEVNSLKLLQWKELLSLIASGKLLSIASEASVVLNDIDSSIRSNTWIADGPLFSTWLGKNIQSMNRKLAPDDIEGRRAAVQLLGRALNLGYKDHVIKAAFSDLLSGDEASLGTSRDLISKLPAHEQRLLLFSLIAMSADIHMTPRLTKGLNTSKTETKSIGGVAALIAALVAHKTDLHIALTDWLIGISANAIGQSHMLHRAIILVLSHYTQQMMITLQRGFEIFGDKLYIKHTPVLHQEVTSQILLILAGYIYRKDRAHLVRLSQSSIYLNAISNHIAASSPRIRFLGMVVGTAVSAMVDVEGKQMNFGIEDLNGPEGLWYKSLTDISDAVGSIRDLAADSLISSKTTKKAKTPTKSTTASSTPAVRAPATSKIISIEEITDDTDSEEDDLPTYEKPNSDLSDEDEDPTLVQRNRPVAPVYIRDLVAGLRDTENYDRHKLALTNAANLIRRKSTFGTEVSDNIEELATLLVGLGDKWELEDFQKMRLQAMIAVVITEPLRMGQWFSKTFYNGDYSMGQRASILTTLGLAARELAGLAKEDASLTNANDPSTTFPSQSLPPKLHKIYTLDAAPMNALSAQLEKTMIQPMAASAADQLAGPNALKVRTFSSRLAVEKKRQTPIPNALAKVVAQGYFFPLTGLWRIHLQSHGENSSHTHPFLLSHFLKTLSLILHASGSSTLSLPQMTSEFWDLLLSMRSRATDPSVLEALLFAFLTLLDINGNDQRRVAEEHAKELLETQGWVEGVFELVGGGSEEGDRIRMLAAGVLMRTREVVERYQRMLMGDMVNYM